MCPTGVDSLNVHGNFGAVDFDFVQMDLLGCDLPDDECFSDEELYEKSHNFVLLKSYPDILGVDRLKIVSYTQDLSHFYFINPHQRQTTNVFMMESIIQTKDNIWDIFEASEKDNPLFEHDRS